MIHFDGGIFFWNGLGNQPEARCPKTASREVDNEGALPLHWVLSLSELWAKRPQSWQIWSGEKVVIPTPNVDGYFCSLVCLFSHVWAQVQKMLDAKCEVGKMWCQCDVLTKCRDLRDINNNLWVGPWMSFRWHFHPGGGAWCSQGSGRTSVGGAFGIKIFFLIEWPVGPLCSWTTVPKSLIRSTCLKEHKSGHYQRLIATVCFPPSMIFQSLQDLVLCHFMVLYKSSIFRISWYDLRPTPKGSRSVMDVAVFQHSLRWKPLWTGMVVWFTCC